MGLFRHRRHGRRPAPDLPARRRPPSHPAGAVQSPPPDESHVGWVLNPRGSFLPDLQERIIAYFEGENVDFSTDPAVNLDALTPFDRKVLQTCRKIPPGETTTYGDLAVRVGHPGAARAVGSALAHNPIPLIIPCHRVLRSDGSLGGFSAPGGLTTKQKPPPPRRIARHCDFQEPRAREGMNQAVARPIDTDFADSHGFGGQFKGLDVARAGRVGFAHRVTTARAFGLRLASDLA